MNPNEIIFFFLFIILIIGILFVDLLYVGKGIHVVTLKETGIWITIWVSIALLFYLGIYFFGEKLHGIKSYSDLILVRNKYAPQVKFISSELAENIRIYRHNMSTEFITGYIMEYTLSMDNIFVIMLILSTFSVSHDCYKTVLFWGILGAILLRFIFIFLGSALIQKFGWILFIFAGFLIYSGIKVFIDRNKTEKINVNDHWIVKNISKFFNVYPEFVGDKFFYKQNLKNYITPLFVVLIFVELTDLFFAFDSIPAVFSITRDPYIVFFSNIFAVVGLRSLFFLLSNIFYLFHYLKTGVSVLLTFIGVKLLIHNYLETVGFKSIYSLYFILIVLICSVLASVLFPENKKNELITK